MEKITTVLTFTVVSDNRAPDPTQCLQTQNKQEVSTPCLVTLSMIPLPPFSSPVPKFHSHPEEEPTDAPEGEEYSCICSWRVSSSMPIPLCLLYYLMYKYSSSNAKLVQYLWLTLQLPLLLRSVHLNKPCTSPTSYTVHPSLPSLHLSPPSIFFPSAIPLY